METAPSYTASSNAATAESPTALDEFENDLEEDEPQRKRRRRKRGLKPSQKLRRETEAYGRSETSAYQDLEMLAAQDSDMIADQDSEMSANESDEQSDSEVPEKGLRPAGTTTGSWKAYPFNDTKLISDTVATQDIAPKKEILLMAGTIAKKSIESSHPNYNTRAWLPQSWSEWTDAQKEKKYGKIHKSLQNAYIKSDQKDKSLANRKNEINHLLEDKRKHKEEIMKLCESAELYRREIRRLQAGDHATESMDIVPDDHTSTEQGETLSMIDLLLAKDQQIEQLEARLRSKVGEERERDQTKMREKRERREHKKRLRVERAKKELEAAEADLNSESQALPDSMHAPNFDDGAYASVAGPRHHAHDPNAHASVGSSGGRLAQQQPLPPFVFGMLHNTSSWQSEGTDLHTTPNQAGLRTQPSLRSDLNTPTSPENRHASMYKQSHSYHGDPFGPSSTRRVSGDAQRQPNNTYPCQVRATLSGATTDSEPSLFHKAATEPRGTSISGQNGSDFDAGRWIREDQNRKAGW